MEIVVPDEFRYLYEFSSERPVVKIPDPVLRKAASPVGKITPKTLGLIDEMIRIMKKANGVGLAAPQVGVSQRLLILSPPGVRPTPVINPVLIHAEGVQIGQEGCLSIPGLYGDVERALRVEVEALDRNGRKVVYELEEMAARVMLHEMDHLDGVLFIDKADVSTLRWEHPVGSAVPVE
ncbi:MAG: peptide deformylase [Armatimonadetes bacterium]|nr:peptide deformylase [Armatimonadota bacterium]